NHAQSSAMPTTGQRRHVQCLVFLLKAEEHIGDERDECAFPSFIRTSDDCERGIEGAKLPGEKLPEPINGQSLDSHGSSTSAVTICSSASRSKLIRSVSLYPSGKYFRNRVLLNKASMVLRISVSSLGSSRRLSIDRSTVPRKSPACRRASRSSGAIVASTTRSHQKKGRRCSPVPLSAIRRLSRYPSRWSVRCRGPRPTNRTRQITLRSAAATASSSRCVNKSTKS